jgi:multicomponent Na+:H+ antiporter subunit D
VLGGLGLAGLPPFGTFLGKALVEESAAALGYPWVTAVFVVASVLTGGAALRAAGRIFAGWGPIYEEISAPEGEQEEPEQETEEGHSRTPAVMLLPVVLLLLVGVLSGLAPDVAGQAETAAAHFQDRAAYAALVLDGQPGEAYATFEHSGGSGKGLTTGLASAAGAVGLALFALFRQRLPLDLSRPWRKLVVQPVAGLKALHNGHVGDYVAWLTIGVAVLGGICAYILL